MLNAKSVDALKAKEKQYKTADKDGLYLLTRTNGNRLWQYKYRFAGKEKVYSYGQYPEVSLLEARQAHEVIRKHANRLDDLANGAQVLALRRVAS